MLSRTWQARGEAENFTTVLFQQEAKEASSATDFSIALALAEQFLRTELKQGNPAC